MQKSQVGAIVLAAGSSTRMGRPKQLLPFQGRSLLRHTIDMAISSVCQPVVVVLGAFAERIQPDVAHLPVKLLQNDQWAVGMGTSIQLGLHWLETCPETIDAVVILVCDQPLVTAHLINQLVESHRLTRKSIVASTYANTVGVPVLFGYEFFPILKRQNAAGAKSILDRYPQDVATVSFPNGHIDIDTPTDAENWLMQPIPDQRQG